MPATDVEIDGYERTEHTADGATRTVYRKGSGPAVVVIAEMPGITPKVIDFADRVEALGFTVALPHLFGVPGADPWRAKDKPDLGLMAKSFVPACVSKEFTIMAMGKSSPVMGWLRSLGRALHDECGGPGIGVVGMCFTGGFALGMIADAPVLAPVLSQPSVPFPVGTKRKGDLGLSPEDEKAMVEACAAKDLTVLGLRFTGDPLAPPERFVTLRTLLGDRFIGVEIDSAEGNPHGHRARAHSVLTEDLVDEPGTPTRDALDQVLDLFRTRLLVADPPG